MFSRVTTDLTFTAKDLAWVRAITVTYESSWDIPTNGNRSSSDDSNHVHQNMFLFFLALPFWLSLFSTASLICARYLLLDNLLQTHLFLNESYLFWPYRVLKSHSRSTPRWLFWNCVLGLFDHIPRFGWNSSITRTLWMVCLGYNQNIIKKFIRTC